MKFIKSKKGLALLATLVIVAASAIGAYAYLTTGGSGSGTATAGSTTNDLVISGSKTDDTVPVQVGTGILPGTANAVTVTYYITNPNDYGVQVSSVFASSITQSNNTCETGGTPAGQLAADFSYTDGGGADGVTVAAGATDGPYTGTLTEADDSANNQDACTGGAPYNNSTTVNLASN